jgi:hypothetical protein
VTPGCVLARKISRAKWEQVPGILAGEIGADAVTADLRTSGNALSFWRCEGAGVTSLEAAALAIAAAADRVDRLDVAWVAQEAIEAHAIKLLDTDGDTPVVELRRSHVDASLLDLTRLSHIARALSSAVVGGQVVRLTKAAVLALLVGATKSGKLRTQDLSEKVRLEVESKLS